jgi:hypothetical protein
LLFNSPPPPPKKKKKRQKNRNLLILILKCSKFSTKYRKATTKDSETALLKKTHKVDEKSEK